MNGKDLDKKFQRTAILKSLGEAKFLSVPGAVRETPSDLAAARGVVDSVTEQAHRVDADWDAGRKKITIRADAHGPGYCIPYIGNGIPGVGTAKRGLGTYTPLIAAGGGISWVITGPFSGCSAVMLTSGTDKAFAHVITPARGYTAASVETQISDIEAQLGAARGAVVTPNGAGIGYVLWSRIDNVWYRRAIYLGPDGGVIAVEGKTLSQ